MFRSTQWGQYMSSWRCWSWLCSLSFCLKLWSLLHHRQVCSHSCACRGLSFFPNPCILDFNKHSDQGVKCLASGKGINYIAFCVNSFLYQVYCANHPTFHFNMFGSNTCFNKDVKMQLFHFQTYEITHKDE